MINFVLDLPSEARPLLTYFVLQKLDSSTDFPLYEKDGLRLIVTGIGKIAAAAATAYLHALRPTTPAVWFNIGVWLAFLVVFLLLSLVAVLFVAVSCSVAASR